MTNSDQSNRPTASNELSDQAKPYTKVSMEPLFERLLSRTFPDSVSAIEYCRELCAEFGFTVKQEASANRNIYVYCSREGLPDSQRNPKPSPQRKRPSKRCDCRWRVVLSENEHEQWVFRKSMNPTASEHNHEMMSPDEMVRAWPNEVNDLIIQLARQRLQTHEIRETVKQRFPDITWNERRFYNRLTEERKRIKQRGVLDRSQRLMLLSARLCAVVASNEEWANVVESEMTRLLDNYCQLSRVPAEAIGSLVDLRTDLIQTYNPDKSNRQQQVQLQQQSVNDVASSSSDRPSTSSTDMMAAEEASPSKKRKSAPAAATAIIRTIDVPKGTQPVHVPSFTMFVRSQPMRSSSEASSQVHAVAGPSTTTPVFPLASPTSSSSSSTSSLPFPYNRRFEQQQQHHVSSPTMVQSPHDPTPHTPFMAYNQSQQQQQQHPSANYTVTPAALSSNYPISGSFAPYHLSTSSLGGSQQSDISFGMDYPTAFTPTTPRLQQQQQHGAATPMPGFERPEPPHPHDASSANYRRSPSTSTGPSTFQFYPVKQEHMTDQRAMLFQQQQQQSEQGGRYMPSSPLSMMRPGSDQQQQHPSIPDNSSWP